MLPTNGFSMIDMGYDKEFTIKVYDLGGHERIRDIWTNYYAEVKLAGSFGSQTARVSQEEGGGMRSGV